MAAPRRKAHAQQRPKTCRRCGVACRDKDALAHHKALMHPSKPRKPGS